jgi:hypothetical protein
MTYIEVLDEKRNPQMAGMKHRHQCDRLLAHIFYQIVLGYPKICADTSFDILVQDVSMSLYTRLK